MPTYRAADGAELHYDLIGPGDIDPIITLAGGPACHPSYLGDLAGLGRRWQLAVPHLRGVGQSPHPERPETGSFWSQAADVEALRSHLGLDRAVIAGHSAGSRLAIAYAAQFPERVAALLLITPPAAYLVDEPSDLDLLIARGTTEPVIEAALAALETDPDLTSNETFNAGQQAVAPIGYAAWGEVERTHAAASWWDLRATQAFFSVEPPADLAARLQSVSAPVLVIAGGQDHLLGRAPVAALTALFPAGELVVIEGSAHFPWVEQPAAFLAAAEVFLAGRVRKGG